MPRDDPPVPPRKNGSPPAKVPPADVEAQVAAAKARISTAHKAVQQEMEAAAARIATELRATAQAQASSLGFLDDVVDFTNDVVDATEEIAVHVANDVNDLTEIVSEITEYAAEACPALVGLAETAGVEQQVKGPEKLHEASAQQLLEARQSILEANAAVSSGLKEVSQSIHNQLQALRRRRGK